jgi:hypothetical protein
MQVSKGNIVSGIALLIMGAIIAFAIQELSKPFVQINIGNVDAFESGQSVDVWLTNLGGSSANDIRITVSSSSQIVGITPVSLLEQFVLEPQQDDSEVRRLSLDLLNQDRSAVFRVQTKSSEEPITSNLYVGVRYAENGIVESYLIQGENVKRTTARAEDMPYRLLFVQSLPAVAVVAILALVLRIKTVLRALMAANLFLMVNKRKFMARQIVRDAQK